MARSLGVRVVAEGIETAEQRDFLRQIGCNHGQGFYLSRPIAPEQIATLMLTQQSTADAAIEFAAAAVP